MRRLIARKPKKRTQTRTVAKKKTKKTFSQLICGNHKLLSSSFYQSLTKDKSTFVSTVLSVIKK
jgi:transcription elongation factor Elf1